ncbi:acetyl-CoA carboxylase biotin carboxylase subunit [Neokomagataea thailandica NBRC 106555]|uniref:biotin carboxylase n=2 Tax=Neokomagataea TaxID=1223423 RepID=A0A4Y6V799_9PROT|nr:MULTISPECIES: acetyl-CoA carboxylase biotin carboxylase subunit [Neokomagataea]QDH25254.1 acetyl-CoA carboxylase biotin carboxylase subunit [Neokomagataea tanensis]GBR54297.1 acetyl-CoA carboxylase biotin carboxylase subunit [Neokomagataea thailandica NBRC 106555]
MPKTQRVLIANRGEIALRIARACRRLGLETIAVFSEADAGLAHLKLVDHAICIGPASPAQSYLNQERILTAATLLDADFIHPGYGFFSENSDFADEVEKRGFKFIGPSGSVMRLMGDKISAKRKMQEAGVPCLPGSDGALPEDPAAAQSICDAIGYPLIVKASAGGGGRGMRVVEKPENLLNAIAEAQRESQLAFGKKDVYAERFLQEPRHVEVQVIADQQGQAVWLGARDCSTQRRHQKLIEEAPPHDICERTLCELGQKCAEACRHIGYEGVGTFEFLYEAGQFFFIEMNTRLQVEHPVTEAVTGIDIVAEQIRIAQGEPLSFAQEDVACVGHAIECRINAENPVTFQPSPGAVTTWLPAGGSGVRLDTHVYTTYTVPAHYDSLIGKLIVHGKNREDARQKMLDALGEMRVEGIETTIPLLSQLLNTESFRTGRVSVHSIDKGRI